MAFEELNPFAFSFPFFKLIPTIKKIWDRNHFIKIIHTNCHDEYRTPCFRSICFGKFVILIIDQETKLDEVRLPPSTNTQWEKGLQDFHEPPTPLLSLSFQLLLWTPSPPAAKPPKDPRRKKAIIYPLSPEEECLRLFYFIREASF